MLIVKTSTVKVNLVSFRLTGHCLRIAFSFVEFDAHVPLKSLRVCLAALHPNPPQYMWIGVD